MNGTFEAYKTVAFDIIREQLADLANSAEAREMARGLVPCMEEGELRRSMRDTTQARQMLELAGTPPMPAMEHTAEFVARSVRGELLTPEEMEEIGPKNLRPPAISPMVRERREASARAELEGR